MPVRRIGADAEDRAAQHLLDLGWTLVTRRWKGGHGELDIVALDGETLVIIEVKARKLGANPEETLTSQKAKRLKLAVDEYLHQMNLEPEALRYDLVAIEGTELRHHKNALVFDLGSAAPLGEDENSDVY